MADPDPFAPPRPPAPLPAVGDTKTLALQVLAAAHGVHPDDLDPQDATLAEVDAIEHLIQDSILSAQAAAFDEGVDEERSDSQLGCQAAGAYNPYPDALLRSRAEQLRLLDLTETADGWRMSVEGHFHSEQVLAERVAFETGAPSLLLAISQEQSQLSDGRHVTVASVSRTHH